MSEESNRNVLITGGARRIGAATARHLHQQGMNIVIHHNSSSHDAEELRNELCNSRPDSVSLIRGNLKDISAMKQLIRETIQKLGRLDALINNASAFYPTPLSSSKEDDWDNLFTINLKAPYFLAQAAAPYLKKQKGCIVSIIDIYAQRPLMNHAIYCATKAGLASVTRSLANELGPDIRVNGVAPGAILWPENDTDEIAQQRMISDTPLKRMGTPADIAKTIHFLIDGPDFITGQILNVDGGRTVTP